VDVVEGYLKTSESKRYYSLGEGVLGAVADQKKGISESKVSGHEFMCRSREYRNLDFDPHEWKAESECFFAIEVGGKRSLR
jgi:hypothetical protein